MDPKGEDEGSHTGKETVKRLLIHYHIHFRYLINLVKIGINDLNMN